MSRNDGDHVEFTLDGFPPLGQQPPPRAQQEKQKAVLSELVGKLTDVCWDKCITSTLGSKFSSSESSCLTNCAQRFMEASSLVLRRFQSLQQ